MTDKELEKLYELIRGRIDEVNTFYLRKVAEQMVDIGKLSQSRVNMLVQMRRMGMSIAEINKKLEKATKLNTATIQKMHEQVAAQAYTDAEFMYIVKGIDPPAFAENHALQTVVRAIARQTAETMENYANTTNISGAYKKAVTEAIQAVQNGTVDYNSAIRQTIKRTAGSGIGVEYESGVTRRLDSAVRQNVVDGVKQINQQSAMVMAEQVCADGYELSAHPNSAPDHEPIQGHVLDKENYERMQRGEDFTDADGIGFKAFKRQIAEWNCKHFASPFLIGISKRRYTADQLLKWREDNAKGCIIGGKHFTMYQANQKMREIEADIRHEKDVANAARITGDDMLRRQCQGRITDLKAQYNLLAGASGLNKRLDRTYVEGFKPMTLAKNLHSSKTSDIVMSSKQFGKKAGRHMSEWGLDPSKQEDRKTFESVTRAIVDTPDEKRRVAWNKNPETGKRDVLVDAYIKGEDVVLVDDNGAYTTTLKDGINNRRVKNGKGE